jgi:hypothetical protein
MQEVLDEDVLDQLCNLTLRHSEDYINPTTNGELSFHSVFSFATT